MIVRVIFRPKAVEDVASAAGLYNERSSGLGEELIDEILRATDRAARSPDLFKMVWAQGEARRVLTDRFPYRISFP